MPVAFGSGKLGPPELGVVGRGHPTAADPPSARSRLHSNHLFCDCHLAWLSQWLRQRPTIGLFTQCAAPAQLRGLNVAEIQKNEFSCSGEGFGEAAGTGAGTRMGSQSLPRGFSPSPLPGLSCVPRAPALVWGHHGDTRTLSL